MFDGVRRSFPAKLLVATVLVLAVAGGYAAVTAAETTENVRQEAVTDLTTDAEQASATTAVWLDRVESQAQTVSTLVENRGPAAAVEEFSASHDLPSGVVGVGYWSDGRYAAATADGMVGTDPAVQGAPWVGTVGQERQFSAPYNVTWYDRPVVAMTLPAGDGQVVTLLDLHEFSESIGPNHENVVIADADRQIVASHDVGAIGSTHRAVGGTIPALTDGGDAEATVMDDRGMVMAFAPVKGAPWTLMVHQSSGSAFATAGAVGSNLVAILFMGIVGLVVVGATVGSSAVISVRQLSRRAEQMADGNLDVPLETRRIDEFGRLYQSLATMRDDLRKRIEAAEQAREEAEQAEADAEAAREEAEREREEVEAFNRRLRQTAAEYAETMQAAAAGDLTQRLDTQDRSEAMAEIGEEFNDMLREIEETTGTLVAFAEDVGETAVAVESRAGEVQEASEQVAASIEEIQTGARAQDDSLEAAVEEIEELSASAEEIAATTDDVAETSQGTAEAAEAGTDAAARALEEMDDVVRVTAEAAAAIETLDDEMTQIGEIVDVISDIAEETNMLALNASIEAARVNGSDGDSGSDGQGFAVVADEVKTLSEETKQSADEIEQRIRAVERQTGDAVETVGQAREAVEKTADTVREALSELETIAERVERTDRSIQEISGVTSDQAGSAQAASGQIEDVAEISRQTVAEADEVAAAADQQTDAVEAVRAELDDLRGQARSLTQLLDQFTVGTARTDGSATQYSTASTDGGQRRQGGE